MLFAFVTSACSTTQQAAPENKVEEKIYQFTDLCMTFDEFKTRYNNFVIENKTDYMYMIRDENIQSYGIYNLCIFPYITMTVYIDNKTKNISSLKVYSEYDKRTLPEIKNDLFNMQKWIFLSSSEILISKMEDNISKIKDSGASDSEVSRLESITNGIKNSINKNRDKQFNDYFPQWDGKSVSMKLSSDSYHIDTDELPSSSLIMTFEEFKNKYNANVQKDVYALGDFLIRDENIQYAEGMTMCIFPYVVMALDIDKNNGYIKNILCYSEEAYKLEQATAYSLAATVFDSQWDNKTYRQSKMKTLLFGSGGFTDKNIKYYKIEQGKAIMLVIHLEE